jgi:hypothetical protein
MFQLTLPITIIQLKLQLTRLKTSLNNLMIVGLVLTALMTLNISPNYSLSHPKRKIQGSNKFVTF